MLDCPYYECFYSTDLGAVGVDNFQETDNVASFYNPNADGDGPNNAGVTWADWNTVTLDLTSYQGQDITVVFRSRMVYLRSRLGIRSFRCRLS